MVNTRGQQLSTAQIDPALDQTALTANLVAAAVTPLHIDVQAQDERLATHTRQRKRRRSASPTIDGSSRPSKRSNLQKAPSPAAKRISPTEENGPYSPHNTSPCQGVRSSEQEATSNFRREDESGDEATLRRILQGHSEEASLSENEDFADGASPNMHAVMSKIIDHGETIDNQYEVSGEIPTGLARNRNTISQGASLQLKIQSLPILDNLARQILATFANSSQAYSTLKSLFDHTKKVYSIRAPFLSPRDLGLVQREQVETIRKANLGTFISSVFGSQDVGFYDLIEFFLDTFVADGGRLLKNQAGLFLDLKTQAYISAIAHRDRSREDILQDLFPDDMEQRLLDRRSGATQLGPGEIDFIQRSNNRKKTLLEESMTEAAIAQLPHKYVWDEFLRDISGYVSKNSASIIGLPVNVSVLAETRLASLLQKTDKLLQRRKATSQARNPRHFETEQPQQSKRQVLRKDTQEQLSQEPDAAPATAPKTPFVQVAQMLPPATDNITEKAARAAQFALEDFGVTNESAGVPQKNGQEQQEQQPHRYPFQFEQQPAPYYTQQNQFDNGNQQHLRPEQPEAGNMGPGQSVFMHGHVPYPTQTAPTSILYERARQAATVKVSPSNKRAGHPSQRRPWSTEEENALMSGLDQVKGPHWSQILALYGPGGTMNETLKDRNQVQLKDKARNLKLFFLKSGIEVPYYLQFVTGELKTRAPQLAKQEQQRNEDAAQIEEKIAEENGMQDDSTQVNDVQQISGAAEPDTNMEDGEGEVIDPAEYAAVHGVASHVGAPMQTAMA
ncbi:MAG: hypothetical protein Q9215_006436 [Flavoplaca cf. flavocitrina]